jgi:hypothetical protein
MAVLIFLVLAGLAFRGMRWAYLMFVGAGLLYFPARVGFRLSPGACELILDVPLALHSLTNVAHIVLFGVFFAMSCAQFRGRTHTTLVWAALLTLAMGLLVEVSEGITGKGHCRLRDVVPDAAGVVIGAVVVSLWRHARPTGGGSASG